VCGDRRRHGLRHGHQQADDRRRATIRQSKGLLSRPLRSNGKRCCFQHEKVMAKLQRART
jgi:hypothetical protein